MKRVLSKNLIRKIVEHCQTNQIVRGLTLLLRGTLAAQIIGIVSMPLLSRWFPVEAFGQYQLFISIVTVALVAASMRYEMAILTSRNRGEVISVFQLCVLINIVMALIAGAVIAGVMAWPGLVDTTNWKISGWLIAIATFVGGMLQILNYLVMRFGAYREGGNIRIVQAGATSSASILIGIIKPFGTGIIIGDIIGKVLAVSQLIRLSAARNILLWPIVPRRRLAAVARRYRDYALISVPSSLISAVTTALASVMIVTTYGPEITGQFGLVERTSTLAVNTAVMAVSQVFATRLAELVRQGAYEDASRIFRRTTGVVALLALPPCIVLAVIAPWLFSNVFGPQWGFAGEVCRIMTICYYGSIIQGAAVFALITMQRQRTQFTLDLSRLCVIVAVWIAVRVFDVGPLLAIGAHFSVMAIYSVIFTWVVDRMLRSRETAVARTLSLM